MAIIKFGESWAASFLPASVSKTERFALSLALALARHLQLVVYRFSIWRAPFVCQTMAHCIAASNRNKNTPRWAKIKQYSEVGRSVSSIILINQISRAQILIRPATHCVLARSATRKSNI
jgi:hypothetical protein